MKRCLLVASLALAALVVVGLAGSAAAGEIVPFKGVLEGTVTRSLPPPPIHVDIAGVGTATQLGLFTVDIPHDVVPPNGVGSYHFVAANGDTLTATFTGVSAPADPGFLLIVETAIISGGTGRFAGASGAFVCERLFDIAGGTTVGSFEGAISVQGKH
jgi:hypothetical protein